MVNPPPPRYRSSTLPSSGRRKEPRPISFRKWALGIAIIIASIIAINMMFKYNKHQALIAAIKHGVLIDPPTTIEPLLEQTKVDYPTLDKLLVGKWGLVYITTDSCKDVCVNNIAKMLNLHDQFISSTKVPYIMLVTLQSKNTEYDPIKNMLEQQYPTIWYVSVSSVNLQKFLDHVPTGSQTLSSDRLYIVNENLDAIASYNPEIPQADLASDFHGVDTN